MHTQDPALRAEVHIKGRKLRVGSVQKYWEIYTPPVETLGLNYKLLLLAQLKETGVWTECSGKRLT